ncbi:TPA: ATP-binding protein, partial [Listeria monocytogenes]|nr:ATP-binding protein [Listeria monocytogenes]
IKMEMLIPNTINYFVVIDTVQGLFIGETFQSKIPSSDSVHESLNNGISEKVYPEIGIDVIGLMRQNESSFKLSGMNTVGVTDKVYVANEELIIKYLESIEIKTHSSNSKEEKLPPFANFSNMNKQKVALKPSTLFNRHLMTIGTTNSGKSTSALSILDKLIQGKKKVLIIDPTGEYCESFDDITRLTLGEDTTLCNGELTALQWQMLFETNDNTQGAILSDAMKSLRFQKQNTINTSYIKKGKLPQDVQQDMSSIFEKSFDLDLLPDQINQESVVISGQRPTTGLYIEDTFRANVNNWLIQKVRHKLENSSLTDFFNDNSKENLLAKLDVFTQETETSLYINSSKIGTTDGIGGMIIDLISDYLVNKNTAEIEPFVIFIDEVHRYTKSPSLDFDYHTGLTSIAREGRKKGIFLFLTTQNPNDVSDILLGQIGTLLIHRLTHYEELKSIQNHLKSNSLGQIKKLNQGECILASINLLQDIHLNFEKCQRKHNNETPLL